MKIGVVGDSATATGFRLAGVKDAYEVAKAGEAVNVLKKLVSDANMGLIIISEGIADEIREDIKKLTGGKATPLIVEIPSKKGPIEKKVDPIKEMIRKAVGIEIKPK